MDYEPNDDDYGQACKLHGEALEAAQVIAFLDKYAMDKKAAAGNSRWMKPSLEIYANFEAPRSLEFTLRSRGWTRAVVLDYAGAPERGLPRKWPPKDVSRSNRPGGDWGAAPDPMQAVRNVLRRLGRSVLEAPLPSPERQKELTTWLRRNLEGIGVEPVEMPAAAASMAPPIELAARKVFEATGAAEDEWARGFTQGETWGEA